MQKWERRDKKLQARKNKMKKHGKGIGQIYSDAIKKKKLIKEIDEFAVVASQQKLPKYGYGRPSSENYSSFVPEMKEFGTVASGGFTPTYNYSIGSKRKIIDAIHKLHETKIDEIEGEAEEKEPQTELQEKILGDVENFEEKMIITIIKSFLEKAKVYVESEQEAPKEVSIQTGPRGGKYYESKGKGPVKDYSKHIKPKLSKFADDFLKEISNSDISMPIGAAEDRRKDLTENLRSLVEENFSGEFEKYNIPVISKTFAEWKEASSNYYSVYFMALIKSKEDNLPIEKSVKEIATKMIDRILEESGPSAKIKETMKSVISSSKKVDWAALEKGIEAQRNVIKEIFKGKTIKLYRGCNGKSVEGSFNESGDDVALKDNFPISRWTLSRNVAKDFVFERNEAGKKAFIISCNVSADKIIYMDGISHFSKIYSPECEVDIDSKGVKAKIEAVYDKPKY